MNTLKFGFNHVNETQDNLVLAFNELVSDFRANKSDTKEYKENNAKYAEAMVKYCLEGTGIEFKDMDMVKDPQLSLYNVMFTNRFSTLLAQSITPAVPEVTSEGYDKLYEVFQVGFGDNAKYTVESNEYFIVMDISEGQTRGNAQTMYDTEYTITARPKQISVKVDWYKVGSGVFDFGRFGAKIAKSYESYIQLSVVKASF